MLLLFFLIQTNEIRPNLIFQKVFYRHFFPGLFGVERVATTTTTTLTERKLKTMI